MYKLTFAAIFFTLHISAAEDTSAVAKSKVAASPVLQKADQAFALQNYREAINLYQLAFSAPSPSANVIFKYALCHHYLLQQPDLCASLFKQAIVSTDPKYNFYDSKEQQASIDALYFLGKTHLTKNNTDSAIIYFALYQNRMTDVLPLDVGRQLIMCVNNNQLVNQPRQIKISTLGNPLNSAYNDGHPVLSIDGKVMYLSSRRPDIGQPVNEALTDNDIYISYKVNDRWSEPSPFDHNTPQDEEPLYLNLDGNRFYFAQEDKKGKWDIWFTERIDSKWTKPSKFSLANSSADERGLTISADGNLLIISSNREGGWGGYDLYVAQKKGNGWGPFKNMGPKINTALDELNPHLHPTENKLYFASNGNTQWGMGGFDIFFAQQDSGSAWSEPFTMGYPINTGSHELAYYVASNGVSVYSTLNEQGDFDIYNITVGEFERKIEDKIVTVVGTETVTEVQLLEVEKEKLVEVDKEVEVTKIEEVEKEVEKSVGYVGAEEAKTLDKVIAIEEKEVAVETIVETEKLVYTNKSQLEIDSLNGLTSVSTTTGGVVLPEDNNTSSSTNMNKIDNSNQSTETNSSTQSTPELATNNSATPTEKEVVNPVSAFKSVTPPATENKALIRPKIHFAASGSDLATIAKQYDISETDIRKWNKLSSSVIDKEKPLIVGYEYNNEIKDLLAAEQLKLAGIEQGDREAIIANIKKYYEDKMSNSNSTIFKNLYFDFNSQDLNLSSTELNILLGFLKEHKEIKLECVGHTDNVGAWETNFWVSRERARKVYQYLIANGISTSRIIFNGKGSTEPIESNYTQEGRAKNRRVEVKLIK